MIRHRRHGDAHDTYRVHVNQPARFLPRIFHPFEAEAGVHLVCELTALQPFDGWLSGHVIPWGGKRTQSNTVNNVRRQNGSLSIVCHKNGINKWLHYQQQYNNNLVQRKCSKTVAMKLTVGFPGLFLCPICIFHCFVEPSSPNVGKYLYLKFIGVGLHNTTLSNRAIAI